MILTELHTERIPEIYKRFAHLVGERHWQSMANALRAEVRGAPILKDYLALDFDITLQLDHLRSLWAQFGTIPERAIMDRAIYPAVSVMAQLISITDTSSPELATSLIRRFHGALHNPEDMRAYRLELTAATHFARRGHRISWPKVSETGTFDLFVEDLGQEGLEVECKSFGDETGRKIGRREALLLFARLKDQVIPISSGLIGGLSLVLTVPDRLPTDLVELDELANFCKECLMSARESELPDGTHVRITPFDAAPLWEKGPDAGG